MSKKYQFSFRNNLYQWHGRLGMLIFSFSFIVIFCLLGVWQLHRYTYKQNILTVYQAHRAAAPKKFLPLVGSASDLHYQRVTVSGEFVNELTMLVQNQFYQDQLGFEVLTPIRLVGENKLLLIDRGWIAKPKDRDLPQIDSVSGKQQLTGYIKLLEERPFILGKNILNPHAMTIVMQRIDIDELIQMTKQQFYPFILRLDASQAHGFIRDWTLIVVPPERHMAYAVQWFVMAFVLLIAFFCFSCERVKK